MSDDLTPEWMRLRREIQALVRGMWEELGRLSDRVHALERRTDQIDRDLEQADVRTRRHKFSIHPRQDDK